MSYGRQMSIPPSPQTHTQTNENNPFDNRQHTCTCYNVMMFIFLHDIQCCHWIKKNGNEELGVFGKGGGVGSRYYEDEYTNNVLCHGHESDQPPPSGSEYRKKAGVAGCSVADMNPWSTDKIPAIPCTTQTRNKHLSELILYY